MPFTGKMVVVPPSPVPTFNLDPLPICVVAICPIPYASGFVVGIEPASAVGKDPVLIDTVGVVILLSPVECSKCRNTIHINRNLVGEFRPAPLILSPVTTVRIESEL